MLEDANTPPATWLERGRATAHGVTGVDVVLTAGESWAARAYYSLGRPSVLQLMPQYTP